MDTVETLLKNLNGGQLQRLALDLLPHIHNDWGHLISLGGCEGGYRTRKGTPDIWCEDEIGNMIYIQATGDSASGKMLQDTKKSVDKLVRLKRNKDALCVSFLNYDPDSEEVELCRSYCQTHGINFIFYNNGQIADHLESYPSLCQEYLGISMSNFIKLNLDYELYYEQIDYFTSILKIQPDTKRDLNALYKELAKNAFEHGEATNVELYYTIEKILFSDNGTKFNLIEFKGKPAGGGGGGHTLRHLISKYQDLLYFSYGYHKTSSKNKIEINICKKEQYKFTVSDDCSLTIPKINREVYKSNLEIVIPKHCNTVKVQLDFNAFILSDFITAFMKILRSIPESHKIEIAAKGGIPSYIEDYIKEKWNKDYKRIKLINEN